jgi:tetratricopeptide (TPR) repeat protein
LSVRYYDRAVALGSRETRGWLGDALLHCGRYREAYETFQAYLTEVADPEPEWWLKARAVPTLMTELGVDAQSRLTRAAREAVDAVESAEGHPGDESSRRRMQEAVRLDGLCAPAWYGLGVASFHQEDFQRAFDEFLVAAVLSPNLAVVWLHVFGLLRKIQRNEELFENLYAFAFRMAGPQLIDLTAKLAAQVPLETEEKAARERHGLDAVRLATEFAAHYGKPRLKKVFRLLGTGADYQEYYIGQQEDSDEH